MAQIKGVSITATTVKELKATIDELRGALLQLSKADEQYDEKVQQLQAHQAKLNEVMALTSKATMQEKQAISAVAGSYDELVAKAAQLRKEWRAIEIGTPEWTKQAEEINKITTQLKDADAAIGNHQRKVGDYTGGVIDAFAQLRGEIKKYKAELLQAEEGSEEYRQALAKLGEAQFRMKDMTEQAKYAVADVGEVLGAVSKTAQGVVGGFNAMQGVMALAGGESENLQKVMVKLQAGMAIVQGLQGLEGMIDSVKGLRIVLNNGVKSVMTFIKSLSGVQMAFAGLGIGAVVAGIIALVNAFDDSAEAEAEAERRIEQINRKYEEFSDTLKDISVAASKANLDIIVEYANKLKASSGDIESIARAIEGLNKQLESADKEALNRQLQTARDFVNKTQAEVDSAERAYQAMYDFLTHFEYQKWYHTWAEAREEAAEALSGEKRALDALRDSLKQGQKEVESLEEKQRESLKRIQLDYIRDQKKAIEEARDILDTYYADSLSDRERELYILNKQALNDLSVLSQSGANAEAILKANEYWAKKKAAINEKYYKKELEGRERAADLQRSMEIHIAQDQQERWQRFADEREAMLEKAMEEFAQAADFIEREAQAAEDELTSWADTYLKGVDAERQGIEKNIEAVKQDEAEKLRYANISKDTEKERAKAIYDIKQQSLFEEAALLRQGLESGVLYGEQRVEAEERIAQIERDIAYNTAEYKIEQNQRAASTIVRVLSSSANAMGNILGSIADMYEQEGEANQEAMEKAKNLRIAGATMDMLGGVVAALSGLFTDKSGPWDFILAGLQATSILASGIANISKIEQTDVSGKSSGGTSGTSAIVSAPTIVQQVPITRTLTGVAEEERLNQASRVYVVYDDIAQVGRKVEVTETETTF